jgi:hypothetical protein
MEMRATTVVIPMVNPGIRKKLFFSSPKIADGNIFKFHGLG